MQKDIRALWVLMKREFRILSGRWLYWFVMVVAPMFCFLFFMDLLKDGLPTNLPIAVVDEDNTAMSRQLVRTLNSFAQSEVAMQTTSFKEAREAMQKSEVYGIFHIPADFRRDISTGKEPVISFYTNDTYFLPASLVYKDMRTQTSLANGAVQQTLLLAKGEGGPLLSARLMPVALDSHPLNNPWLSYSVYLANFLLPAFLCMFVMFMTAYSIGEEVKRGTSRKWLEMGRNSIVLSLMGKLIPQAVVFICMGMFYLSLLYVYARFPLNSGFFPMFLGMVMMVLASQGVALFLTGLVRRNRIALSACALWGVLAFSICGFTYPVRSMPFLVQAMSNLFQMRHYLLIYIDQALNGLDMIYSWQSYSALLVFMLLPLLVLRKLKLDLLKFKYMP